MIMPINIVGRYPHRYDNLANEAEPINPADRIAVEALDGLAFSFFREGWEDASIKIVPMENLYKRSARKAIGPSFNTRNIPTMIIMGEAGNAGTRLISSRGSARSTKMKKKLRIESWELLFCLNVNLGAGTPLIFSVFKQFDHMRYGFPVGGKKSISLLYMSSMASC
jgi:hypothetical protein